MSEEKTLRLNKVAKELNVGMSTLVETLAKNGHDVKPSPNTKIGHDLYVLLLKEHQTDQQVKEKSRQMGSISLPKSSGPHSDLATFKKIRDYSYFPSRKFHADSSLRDGK